jgi:ABC-type transport system substrate-binding protein
MRYQWFKHFKVLLFTPLVIVFLFAAGCGGAADPEVAPEAVSTSPPEAMEKPEAAEKMEAVKATEKPMVAEKDVAKDVKKPEVMSATSEPTGHVPDWVSQGKYGGVIPMMSTSDPVKWDVHQACCVSGPNGSSGLFNNLVEFNPVKPDELIGDLAESWELSEDSLSYTFRLNEASWWDGEPVTADDVKFSIDRWAEPKLRPRVKRISAYIGEVEVIDPKTVQATLKFPGAPALLPFLAVTYMKIYPKHWIESDFNPENIDPEPDFNPEEILGSGPFKFVEYERGNFWEHEKNEDYWKEGRPFWDGYRVTVVTDNSRKIAAYRTEQALMQAAGNTGIPTRDLLKLSEELKDEWDFHFQPPTGIGGFLVNFHREPFDDPRVRRAINLAIDRKQIVEGWAAGRAEMGTPFPPGTWMSASPEEIATWPGYRYVGGDGKPVTNPFVEGARKDPADLEEARRLLAEAGFPDGIKGYEFLTFKSLKERAQLVQLQLKEVGIELTLGGGESTSIQAKRASGDFYFVNTTYGLNIQDPDDILGALYLPGGSRNLIDWTNEDVIRLSAEQTQEPDQAKRRVILKEIEDILRQGDSHFVSLAWAQQWVWPVSKKIKNFFPPDTLQLNLKYEHLWLDERYTDDFK